MFAKLFERSKKNRSEFKLLHNYINKEKYFTRTKPWGWLNEKEIYLPMVIDEQPTMTTMDFWSQEIYLDATGQITVSELIERACKQYEDSKMEIPESIDKVLIESLESLVYELKIVEFSDEKKKLPKEIEDPIFQRLILISLTEDNRTVSHTRRTRRLNLHFDAGNHVMMP